MKDKMKNWKKMHHHGGGAGAGAVYGLGLVGALIYFIQHANSFSEGLLGVLKALVWPAVLIYKVLELLKI
jgi:hypothetical protein